MIFHISEISEGSTMDPFCPIAWLQEELRGFPKTVIVLTWTLVVCGMMSI